MYTTQRILLLLFGGIGDVLLFTPALEALAKEFPKVPIDAVVRNDNGERVLKYNPYINDIIVYDKNNVNRISERFRLLRRIRREKYITSITICVDFDYKTGLLALLSGATKRIGPNIRRHGIFYNVKVPIPSHQHFIFRNYELVKRAGVIQPLDETMRFYLDREERLFAQKFFESHGLATEDIVVGIHPGGSPWRIARRWPRDKYIEVINLLIKKGSLKVILMGGPDERETVDEILEKSPGVIPANAPMTLGQFAALIERCTLFLCNDGGPTQVAAAIGTPTITIVGPTDPRAFAPIGKQHTVVKTHLPCSPCIDCYDYNSDGCEEQTCMKSITVSQVMEVISEKLKEISTGTHSKVF